MKEQYLLDFLDSLKDQTYHIFDLIIVNDGYPDFHKIRSQYTSLSIIELNPSTSPVKNREVGINYVLEQNYDILIFGDSDDYFKNNRIETSLRKLQEHDIVVNDLTLFNQNGIFNEKYLSNRVLNNSEITLEMILHKNIFGLSNTALRCSILEKCTFSSELIALDWYLFTILLLKGHKAIFTNETVTFYRQHGHNIVGLGQRSKESLLRTLSVKEKHYGVLKQFYPQYLPLYEEMNVLHDKIRDENYLNDLLDQVIDYPLWWEELKSIKEKT